MYQIKGFHEIHIHSEYEVCRWNKIISNAKVATKQTDIQTDRQGKNNMPPLGSGGGIKRL